MTLNKETLIDLMTERLIKYNDKDVKFRKKDLKELVEFLLTKD